MYILVNKKDGLILANDARKFPQVTYVAMENPHVEVEVESIPEGMTHYKHGKFVTQETVTLQKEVEAKLDKIIQDLEEVAKQLKGG